MTDAMPPRCSQSSLAVAPFGCGSYEPTATAAGTASRAMQGGTARPRVRTECGDLPFLIRRDGTWLYRGSVVARKELVCLFASVLKRDRHGAFWLETPAERGRIEVEDAPFVAVELDWRGCGCAQTLSFRTNVDQCVTVGEDHPLRVHRDPVTGEPTPYLLVRPGEGAAGVEARVNRATYYELVALAVPETVGGARQLGVWSCQRFFPLGDVPDGEYESGEYESGEREAGECEPGDEDARADEARADEA